MCCSSAGCGDTGPGKMANTVGRGGLVGSDLSVSGCSLGL